MYRYYLELIWYKSMAELRAESARAYLGFIWWVFEPILYMIAFYIVFDLVFQRGGPDFIPFLLCGLVVWKWFGSVVASSQNAMSSNAGLMRQVYLPKYIFPIIILIHGTFKFLIIFALFMLFLLVYGVGPSESWLLVPLVILVQLIFIASVAGLVAATVPLMPDLKMVLDNALMLLFFLSGIFFDISAAPDKLKFYLDLNPMAVIIDSYRAVLLDGAPPSMAALGSVVLFSAVLLVVDYLILKAYDCVYPKILN